MFLLVILLVAILVHPANCYWRSSFLAGINSWLSYNSSKPLKLWGKSTYILRRTVIFLIQNLKNYVMFIWRKDWL